MLLSLLVLLIITFSGFVLTYLYEDEDSAFVRLCAGYTIGSSLFGLICFLLACAFGLSATTVLVALLVALAPLVLLIKTERRERVFEDLARLPKSFSENKSGALFYAAITVLLFLFFSRAMFETGQGIYTGGSQNLGDLPFHLGAIFSFSDGQNLPPENPSFAFAKFTYPFMVDFLTACFVTSGAKVQSAMLVQNVTACFALVVLLGNFTRRLVRNPLAGKIAALLFLFSGGLGFLIFFRDYWHDGRSLFEFLLNLPSDYTIRPKGIRWGNALITLLLTQRSLLLGMPITLIALSQLWKVFTSDKEEINTIKQDGEDGKENKKTFRLPPSAFCLFFVGLLAGTLPLVHVHSLAALFIVAAFLFFFRLDKWREWSAFGAGVCLIAVPELLWITTGSASRFSEFFGFHFGWDAGDENVFLFWAKNLGLFIPLLIVAIYLVQKYINDKQEAENAVEKAENKSAAPEKNKTVYDSPFTVRHLYFYLPFLLIFVVANLFKLAPWEWDNIKVLIYWYICSIPFVAWLLANLWERKTAYKSAFFACLIILTFSGALDVWRVVSKQINYQVFSSDAVKIAEQIKQKTAPNALFLNAPTYNSAVVLSGRRSLMRYNGHLSSYGIDYLPREREVKRIYEGSGLAQNFLGKNKVEYVIISPEETANLTVNEDFFSSFPIIAEAGEYKVYQVKK